MGPLAIVVTFLDFLVNISKLYVEQLKTDGEVQTFSFQYQLLLREVASIIAGKK